MHKIIFGAQHGDEAKGIEVERIAIEEEADHVYRYSGGNNAGHTGIAEVNGEEIGVAMHMLSPAVMAKIRMSIGFAAVVNPVALLHEILNVQRFGFLDNLSKGLCIDLRCACVMPQHPMIDMAEELLLSKNGKQIGTTASGMAPIHSDVAGRKSIRMYDTRDPDKLRQLIANDIARKNNWLAANLTQFEWEAIVESLTKSYTMRNKEAIELKIASESEFDFSNLCIPFPKEKDPRKWPASGINPSAIMKRVSPSLKKLWNEGVFGDVSEIINEGIRKRLTQIGEGSQGARLDLYAGDGNYVTSGRTIPGAAPSGAGFSPTDIDSIRAVVKAVPSRVGEGPFITEVIGEIAEEQQGDGTKIDDERGASTGRTRKIGALDAVVIRSALRHGGDCVTLTKLDKVQGPELTRIADAWIINGQRYTTIPADPSLYMDNQVEVEYVDLEPCTTPINGATTWGELSRQHQNFVTTFERLINEGSPREVRVDRLGIGPYLADVIRR